MAWPLTSGPSRPIPDPPVTPIRTPIPSAPLSPRPQHDVQPHIAYVKRQLERRYALSRGPTLLGVQPRSQPLSGARAPRTLHALHAPHARRRSVYATRTAPRPSPKPRPPPCSSHRAR